MIIKNCALLKKTLSAVALLGGVLNTNMFAMEQNRQVAQRDQKTNLALVPADIWAQTDNILGVKNIKGRNTIEKVLLLKETIRKPQQYNLKNRTDEFAEKLLARTKEYKIDFNISVDFSKGGNYIDAPIIFKAAKSSNVFIKLKCENWLDGPFCRLLVGENATQIDNLDLSYNATKNANSLNNPSYNVSTLKTLGEALNKSNLMNLKVLNLSGLYLYLKENPFKGADLDTPFVNYLHLEKLLKLEVLNLKGVNIDRCNYRNWAPEITKDLENIEKTPRPSLGQYSRIRIQK